MFPQLDQYLIIVFTKCCGFMLYCSSAPEPFTCNGRVEKQKGRCNLIMAGKLPDPEIFALSDVTLTARLAQNVGSSRNIMGVGPVPFILTQLWFLSAVRPSINEEARATIGVEGI